MPYYVVTSKHDPKLHYVTGGETETDAVLDAYQHYNPDHYDDEINNGDISFTEIAERLQAETYDCTEINKTMLRQYFDLKLSGNNMMLITMHI